MKLYAERKWRLTRQVSADLAVLAWGTVWVWAGVWLYGVVRRLAVPGEKLEDAGNRLAGNFAEAQRNADSVPLIGEKISAPFGSAADAARGIAAAGQSEQDAVGDVAAALGWATAVMPMLLALMLWVPLRVTWMRTAGAAAKLRTREGGTELLAVRAIATAPLRRLVDLDGDCVAGWRSGDPATIEILAGIELSRLGLRS